MDGGREPGHGAGGQWGHQRGRMGLEGWHGFIGVHAPTLPVTEGHRVSHHYQPSFLCAGVRRESSVTEKEGARIYFTLTAYTLKKKKGVPISWLFKIIKKKIHPSFNCVSSTGFGGGGACSLSQVASGQKAEDFHHKAQKHIYIHDYTLWIRRRKSVQMWHHINRAMAESCPSERDFWWRFHLGAGFHFLRQHYLLTSLLPGGISHLLLSCDRELQWRVWNVAVETTSRLCLNGRLPCVQIFPKIHVRLACLRRYWIYLCLANG